MQKLTVLFVTIFSLFSCNEKPENWLFGKWHFRGITPINISDTTKDNSARTAAFLFLNISSDSSVIEFNNDNTYKIFSKEDKIFSSGKFELKNENEIEISPEKSDAENYTIEKENSESICLLSSKDSIKICLKKINN